MIRLLKLSREQDSLPELCDVLARYDVNTSTASCENGIRESIVGERPDVLLLEIDKRLSGEEIRGIIKAVRHEKKLPLIALVPPEMLPEIDINLDLDDIITSPYDSAELMFRINRLLRSDDDMTGGEVIKRDGLLINLATCEVTIGGKLVELTFKEYEVLKLLAGDAGRVYTREALLNNVWGYDYYGGDRTVDVHVRRLRSKIEDASHTFIETVRNIGYRFKKNA